MMEYYRSTMLLYMVFRVRNYSSLCFANYFEGGMSLDAKNSATLTN